MMLNIWPAFDTMRIIGRPIRIHRVMPSPGGLSEIFHIFCARVDASRAAGIHGVAHEHEDIKVVVKSFRQAMRMVKSGRIHNGTSVLAAHDFPITAGTRTRLDMQWVTNAFTFTAADAASILRLSALTPLNLPGGATAANIFTGPVVDNFNLFPSSGSVATPEPASLSLLGLGAAALLLQRRRAPV